MSVLFTATAESRKEIKAIEHVVDKTGHPPVIITESEVAFSTAAATLLPRTEPAHGLVASVRAILSSHAHDVVSAEDHLPPRHYPARREAFLESAAMAREMRRL
ncbi:hypothetical protein AU198_03365 [Mycobacterium sp. GA-1199]|uniref:hypothetical protein n=1 Tax=Mycobacterium sp. GA-1199 TaxID=1772287 RepID=UPI0007490370|nr:hypothetical protein [Mycobacterium sp. GA-1199]KUI46628.1 hypothetical protein AU198_03365 [Mycobacterium sp. GA-1199]